MDPESAAPTSVIVQRLMFDYERLSRDEMIASCRSLSPKILRWIGVHHPDNRTRLLFYELTNVPIGEGTVINSNVVLYDEYRGLVAFGQRAAVSTGVTIVASSGPNNSQLAALPYVRRKLAVTAPVSIGDDVWLGANATILPGVSVGDSAIVGAGAVVSSDVEPRTVVAGVPARVVRRLV